MRIIALSGHAGCGKDTCAGMMEDELRKAGKNVIVVNLADLLKFTLKRFLKWDGKKDEAGRTLLQTVGTDIVRRLRPDYWVDYVLFMLEFLPGEWDYAIIPDVRFKNEISRIGLAFETRLVRIERPCCRSALTEEQRSHASETEMDGYPCDALIINDGGLFELRQKIKEFVNNECLAENSRGRVPEYRTY